MAVVIASVLDKDMAGEPLFRGVSFKLERGDRMTLAGRNGAGKTTLLRMLAGETGVDGGELAFEKGTRTALHDQRPPRERSLSLRDYVLSGCRDLVVLEDELRGLEQGMAERPEDQELLDRYARAQAPARARGRLELARARDRAAARTRLQGRGARPRPGELLRRGAHAGVARPRARRRPRSAAARRAHEPSRHRVARVARGLSHGPRRGGDPRGPRPLVPRGGRNLGARARGGARALLSRHLARVAPGGRRARARARPGDREAAGRDRAHGALHRALPLQGDEGAPGPGSRSRSSTRWRGSSATRGTSARSASASRRASARAAWCSSSRGAGRGARPRALEDGELWLERGEHVSLVGPNGAGKTTLIEALAGPRALDGGRAAQRAQRQARLPLPAREELGTSGTVLEAVQRATALTPGKARALLGQFLFSGEEAEKPMSGLSGGERRRLSLAILVALRRQRADPRRADEPPRPRRPRGARGRAVGVRRRGAAGVARPRAARRRGHAHGRDRGRPPAQLRRRLGGVLARARGAPRGRRGGSAQRARNGGARAAGAPGAQAEGRRRPVEEPGQAHAQLEREVERAETALAASRTSWRTPRSGASPTSRRGRPRGTGRAPRRRGGVRRLGARPRAERTAWAAAGPIR